MGRTIVVTADLFAGNFVREAESVYKPSKDIHRQKKGRKFRQVILLCKHCSKEFTVSLHNAIRTQQETCSSNCSKRLNEVFEGGNEKHPLYIRWLSMNRRCNVPSALNYNNYGGRGITIDTDLQKFENYAKYVVTLDNYDLRDIANLSLDRKDNDGNYSKGNLRWATRSTQTANQRKDPKRGSNTYKGVGYSKCHNRWIARINYNNKSLLSTTHLTEQEALTARNTFIKLHNLPHPIQY